MLYDDFAQAVFWNPIQLGLMEVISNSQSISSSRSRAFTRAQFALNYQARVLILPSFICLTLGKANME